jgi:1,4-dihydroxy-2-naphthoyl-CoA hydrolase
MIQKEYRIALADTDAAGRIYFARVPEWCHRLWEDYLESKGVLLKDIIKGNTISPVVNIEFQYKKPLELSEKVTIKLTKLEPYEKSFAVHYEIFKSNESTPAILGQINHVCVDLSTGQAVPIPDKLKVLF